MPVSLRGAECTQGFGSLVKFDFFPFFCFRVALVVHRAYICTANCTSDSLGDLQRRGGGAGDDDIDRALGRARRLVHIYGASGLFHTHAHTHKKSSWLFC